ncbi:MAG: putative zinc-binding protein [Desulfatiglandaceae bacterium]
MPYKLLMFTCYGGCATGVSASKALIRVWEENPQDIKIGCLPAVIVPAKLKEIMKSEKHFLVDACGVKCGSRLMEKAGMTVDRYMELTSQLGIKKEKALPPQELEEEIYHLIRGEVDSLLGKK